MLFVCLGPIHPTYFSLPTWIPEYMCTSLAEKLGLFLFLCLVTVRVFGTHLSCQNLPLKVFFLRQFLIQDGFWYQLSKDILLMKILEENTEEKSWHRFFLGVWHLKYLKHYMKLKSFCRYFSKEGMCMIIKHMKTCSASLVIQSSSVQSLSRVRLCDPMNCSTPGLPVHHQLPEFTQTHVHRVSDAIQPSHPLSSPSPPSPIPSQHQSLFQWVNSSHQVAKVLEFQL